MKRRGYCRFCEAKHAGAFVRSEDGMFCDEDCLKLYDNMASTPKPPKKSTLFFESAEPTVDPESQNGERADLDVFDLEKMKPGRRGERRKWSNNG